jgi:hypothetical protein
MSDTPQTPEPPKPKWTGAAITLFAIGLLIFVPSGLCTGIFGIGALVDAGSSNGIDYGVLLMALIVGGIPMLVGFLFIRLGLKERKRG